MDVEIADGCMSELKYGGPQGAAKVTMNSESHMQTEPFGFRFVGVGFSTFETLFLSHSLCHTHTHTQRLFWLVCSMVSCSLLKQTMNKI